MSRILLVDDDQLLTSLLKELLERESYDVQVFHQGKEARVALRTSPYDVIILDFQLPDANGPDLCREFRQIGGRTPVLLLTARNDVGSKEAAFDAEADDYLVKPFAPKELLARLKALVRRSKQSFALEKQPSQPEQSSLPKPGLERTMQENIKGAASRLDVGEALRTFADRYETIAPIGGGSMGLVFKAKDVALKRYVALKVLHPELVPNHESLSRFTQEAQSIAQLSHPNIVAIYDCGVTANGVPYLVMEFIEGESLFDLLTRERQVPWERALGFFLRLCDALAHSHSRGIIHRDIKPSNIMFQKIEEDKSMLKLLDFSIAKVVNSSDQQLLHMSREGEVFGSPLYLSPEQFTGGRIDERSDMFSLGYMFYECVTGIKLFLGDNDVDTMFRRTVELPIPFKILRPDLVIPESLQSIIFKCMAVEPEKRYSSVAQLRSELQEVARAN
jgi:DNA-binding response OmpR family regulator/tRNA A-37 threonylcarbamoyl transferase component Bud32